MTTESEVGHRVAPVARLAVGVVWLAGAAFNLLVTARMSEPYAWLEHSAVPLYRWFFGESVGQHPYSGRCCSSAVKSHLVF